MTDTTQEIIGGIINRMEVEVAIAQSDDKDALARFYQWARDKGHYSAVAAVERFYVVEGRK